MAPESEVDIAFSKLHQWQPELLAVRKIALKCKLTEEIKWHQPCYTFQGGNIAVLQSFKQFCAILFPKGSLLKENSHLLEKPGENSHIARRLRIESMADVADNKAQIERWLKESIALEKAGAKVDKPTQAQPKPAELIAMLDADPQLKKAFEALTPGRQRAYILHFSSAKQPATRTSRIEKCMPRILEGLGLND